MKYFGTLPIREEIKYQVSLTRSIPSQELSSKLNHYIMLTPIFILKKNKYTASSIVHAVYCSTLRGVISLHYSGSIHYWISSDPLLLVLSTTESEWFIKFQARIDNANPEEKVKINGINWRDAGVISSAFGKISTQKYPRRYFWDWQFVGARQKGRRGVKFSYGKLNRLG